MPSKVISLSFLGSFYYPEQSSSFSRGPKNSCTVFETFFSKEVKGKRGAAEECSESGAPEILQVAAIGLEQVVYQRKGVFDDLIPLGCADLSPLDSDSRSNIMKTEEEDLDARIEVLL